MKIILGTLLTLFTQTASFAASNISVTVDGRTYTCSQDGSGGGGGNNQLICVCERRFGRSSYVYDLRQSIDGGRTFSTIETFYSSDGLTECGKMRKQVCD